jgi:hypothetical protein
MINKIYNAGLILIATPFLVVGGSSLYTMFQIEPVGTCLNLSFVLGAALIVISWYLSDKKDNE